MCAVANDYEEWQMNVDGPLTEDGEFMFCKVGNALVVDFLNKSRQAVKNALHGFIPAEVAQSELAAALNDLYAHSSHCPDCEEY